MDARTGNAAATAAGTDCRVDSAVCRHAGEDARFGDRHEAKTVEKQTITSCPYQRALGGSGSLPAAITASDAAATYLVGDRAPVEEESGPRYDGLAELSLRYGHLHHNRKAKPPGTKFSIGSSDYFVTHTFRVCVASANLGVTPGVRVSF